MSATVRPRRSVLYMPGSNARAQEKAKTLPADALILDLEDAVAPDAKAAAREQVCATVRGGGFGTKELVIRINALDTPWGMDDLHAACAVGPGCDPRAQGRERLAGHRRRTAHGAVPDAGADRRSGA